MPERKVRLIEKRQYANWGYKAVGIYARVSTRLSSQLHSMSMQISALTQQVYRLPQWQLADIYIDFVSGASASNRAEFQRMLADCQKGKINLILTKSVSRFGRDTVDGLQAIRDLKSINVPVYFDLEEINSFQPDFELQYSLRAAVAQSEPEDFRDNVAMSINRKIKDGTSSIYSRPCYGYKKNDDGSFTIVPEEAETVKLIFNLYLSGKSIIGILRELEHRGIPSPTGNNKWCRRSIDTMLSNEKYRGGSVATASLMSYESPNAQRIKYLYSGHHAPIIDDKTFIAVAEEKQKRSNVEIDESGSHRKKTRYTSKTQLAESEEHD